MKKLLSMALAASMAISALATTAFAANGNVSLRVDDNKTEVAPGERIVVRIDSATKTISTEGFYLLFDTEKFKCEAVTNSAGKRAFNLSRYDADEEDYVSKSFDVKSTADEATASGSVSFGFSAPEDAEVLAKKDFAVITLVAKADAAGSADLVLMENSGGADGYVGEVARYTVEIKSEDPGFEVIDPKITGITVDPAVAEVAYDAEDRTVTFTATVEGKDGQDAEGNVVAYDKTVTWSANAPDGVYTAPAAPAYGEEDIVVEITATAADGQVAKATVTVKADPNAPVPETTVTVTDAQATKADSYKARNTMYWGVKIANGMKGAVEAWMNDGESDSKTTTLDFSNVTINGDAEFGIFTMVTADRLDKAITLNVKDVASGVVGMSTAAAYSELN